MSASKPLNPEQKAIVEAPLGVPLKVVAGAGTGKTETLKSRFVYLVNHHGIAPDRILTVTFTEKAAAEMRQRIEAGLGPGAVTAPGASLYIHTFHGLCARILRDHCYEAGLPPDHGVLDELQSNERRERLLHRLLGGELQSVDELSLERLLDLGLRNLNAIGDAIGSAVAKAKSHGWSPEEFRTRMLDSCQSFWSALPAPDAAPAPEDVFDAIRESLPSKWLGDAGRSAEDKGNDIRKAYYGTVKSATVTEGLAERWGRQAESERIAIRLCAAAYEVYQDELEAQGLLDFDDQILRTVRLLSGSEEVRREYQTRFEYVLVDEFQDTSPVQMELIRLLARSEQCPALCERRIICRGQRLTNVMVVGDKKQSIYAFRDARKENMDLLIPCGGPETVRELTRNYRSGPAIIELANIVAHAVESSDPRLICEAPQPAVVVRGPDFSAEGDLKAEAARDAESAYIAERIQALITGGGFSYRDIAVLVRTKSRFPSLKRAFDERYIPYISLGGLGFFAEPLLRDALATLRLISDPCDDASLVRLLTRPPVGLSDRQLFLLSGWVPVDETDEEALPPALPLLTRLSGCAASGGGDGAELADRLPAVRGFLAGLADLAPLRHAAPAREVLEAVIGRPSFMEGRPAGELAGWPTCREILESVLIEAEDAGEDDLQGFLRRIDLYQGAGEQNLPSPEPGDIDAVRVLTAHKAKGLEFPVVFLPFSPGDGGKRDGWSFDDTWGLIPGDVWGTASIKRLLYQRLSPRREADKEEDQRLFYVGVTRARNRLVVSSTREKEHPYAHHLEALSGLEVETAFDPSETPTRGELPRMRAPERPPAAWEPETLPVPRVVRTSFTELDSMLSCPVRFFIQRIWGLPDLAASPQTTGGQALGTAFHRLVADYLRAPFDPRSDTARARAALEDAGPISPALEEALLARWRSFRASRFAGLRPQAEDVERAIEWSVPTRPGTKAVVTGYIDLVDRGGAYIEVVDFKTHRELTETDRERYAIQLSLYARALSAELGTADVGRRLVWVHEGGVEEFDAPLVDEAALVGLLEQRVEMERMRELPPKPDGAPCEWCSASAMCPYKHMTDDR